jgi:hypothetical protein
VAVYLDESMFGMDTEINYPRLLLCSGVTWQMSDGLLVGCHIDSGATEDVNLAELKRLAVGWAFTHDLAPGPNLYVIGNRRLNDLHHQKSPLDKARALGFQGKIWVYDTAAIADHVDGTFARLFSWRSGPFLGIAIQVCPDPVVQPYQQYGMGDDLRQMAISKRYQTSWNPPQSAFQFPKTQSNIKRGISNVNNLPRPLRPMDFQFVSI